MGSRKSKRVWGLGGLATTMSLAMMASAAFACTEFKGKQTVTAGAGGSGSASADGSGLWHSYCGDHPRENIIAPTGVINVAVARTTKCTAVGKAESQLDAGSYNVYWVAARHADNIGPTNTTVALADGATDPEFFNCNSGTLHNGARQLLGTLSVSSTGTGSGTFNLLGKATPGPGNICVNTGSSSVPSAPQVYINWI